MLITVIVSGYDGAAALCGIKEVGGSSIAQKPESAIDSGRTDSPENIALKIMKIAYEGLGSN